MPIYVTTDTPLNIGPSDPEWKIFEKDVANFVARLDSSSKPLQYDARLMGVVSRVERQVDVLAEGELNGIPISVAIECKKYSRPIDVGEIDAFVGKLRDLSVDKGVFYVYDGVTPGARNRADGALHPKVLLRESVGGSLVLDDWDELLPDCPNENCYGGMVNWTSSRQPAGGEDVSWGYCDSCGTFAFTCRDCGEVESAELGLAECFTCGAKYELESVDYQSTDVGDVIQVSRGVD